MSEAKQPTQAGNPVFDGEIGILARRRIEAGIIAPIYEEMRERLGEELAQSILDQAIRKAAIAAGLPSPPGRPAEPACAVSRTCRHFGRRTTHS